MPAIDGGQVAATGVPILMLTGVPRVPEQDLAHIDAFVQKVKNPQQCYRRSNSFSIHLSKQRDFATKV
jgi:hypothetical protein